MRGKAMHIRFLWESQKGDKEDLVVGEKKILQCILDK
jgi:hypothetical protein